MEEVDGGVDVGFLDGGLAVEDALAGTKWDVDGEGDFIVIDKAVFLPVDEPVFGRDFGHDAVEDFDEGEAVTESGDVERAEVVVGDGSGQWSGCGDDGRAAGCEGGDADFLRRAIAVGARYAGNVAGVFLIGGGEWALAMVALGGIRFVQAGVDAGALVEHEALAVVVGVLAIFEVFQDAAFELVDVLEALLLHEGSGFLTADAAGAEHDDGLVFELRGELADGVGEVAEFGEREGEGVFEGAEFDFVVVASVEKGDGSAFVEPLFELGGFEFR